MAETGFRYPELPENNVLLSNGIMTWYDYVTNTTYRIKVSSLFSGMANPDTIWNPDFEYSEGQVVSYNGKIWIATAEPDNLGQPPSDASDFWDEEPDPAPIGLETVELDTSSDPEIDADNRSEICLVESEAIDSPRTWTIINFANLILIPFIRFSITGGLHVQTLPTGSKLANSNNALWDSAARTWEPLAEGEYEARVTHHGGQLNWIIQGPY